MTVLEALKLAVDNLNGISIPVPQLDSIGAPISRAINLVQISIDAMNENMKAKEETAAEEPEPEESDPE